MLQRAVIGGVGAFFNFVTAIILIGNYWNSDYTSVSRRVLAAGLITFINTVIFGTDSFCSRKFISVIE
jgi:hypothetical protein